MLRLFRKSARKLFLVAAAVALFTAGATRAYALRILWTMEDGSFVGVSCNNSAGPTLVVYDAELNQTFAFAANPDLCKSGSGEVAQ